MRKFISKVRLLAREAGEAFEHGVINASSTGRKVRRWAALCLTWLAALSLLIGGLIGGVTIHPSLLIVSMPSLTLGLLSLSQVFLFSADEYRRETRAIMAESDRLWRESMDRIAARYGLSAGE